MYHCGVLVKAVLQPAIALCTVHCTCCGLNTIWSLWSHVNILAIASNRVNIISRTLYKVSYVL